MPSWPPSIPKPTSTKKRIPGFTGLGHSAGQSGQYCPSSRQHFCGATGLQRNQRFHQWALTEYLKHETLHARWHYQVPIFLPRAPNGAGRAIVVGDSRLAVPYRTIKDKSDTNRASLRSVCLRLQFASLPSLWDVWTATVLPIGRRRRQTTVNLQRLRLKKQTILAVSQQRREIRQVCPADYSMRCKERRAERKIKIADTVAHARRIK